MILYKRVNDQKHPGKPFKMKSKVRECPFRQQVLYAYEVYSAIVGQTFEVRQVATFPIVLVLYKMAH